MLGKYSMPELYSSPHTNTFFFVPGAVLEFELKASHLLSSCSCLEPLHQPFVVMSFCPGAGFKL
jgi:hypothetical protein